MKTLTVICGIFWVASLAGCGGKPSASTSAPATPPKSAAGLPAMSASAQTAPPPVTPPNAPAASLPAAPEVPTYEGKDEAERLTKALQDYYTRHGANAPLVSSVDGLVKAGVIKSVPVPPAGKKYVVDTKTVTVRLE